ncbi:acyltransferase family protein [Luteimonas granuli]|uniref:acyltransferase family protein n=1 Tax=Luteimonas granuli TaxID=1176533 RepID=UPI001AEFFB4A|nr:acyltransferase [Luteimonas granuli]
MQRRHDLDWVRVCAFGLLVLYHVGMYYVSWDWHVKSPDAGPALEPLMLLSAPWRLSLLFLVSGVATAHLLGKNAPGFLRQRSWRLLLPLAVGMFLVVPPQTYYEIVEKAGFADGYGQFYGDYLTGEVCDGSECITTPTWNHLWFVAYLWVYTVVLYGLVRLAPRWLEGAGERLSRLLAGIGVLAWPVLFLALARLALVGRFPSTHALVDDVYNHAQYFPVFLLGFLVARAEGVWNAIEGLRWPALALWLGSWLGLAVYFGLFADAAPPAVAAPGDARDMGAGPVVRDPRRPRIRTPLGPRRRPRAALPDAGRVPGLHPPPDPDHRDLAAAAAAGAHPLLEGPLLVLATFALSFAGYELIRRVRLLRPLFGLKAAMPAPATAAATTRPAHGAPR